MTVKIPRPGADALRGAFDRIGAMGPIRRRAALASAVWTVIVAAYAIGFFGASQTRGTAFLDGAFFLVTLALPLILIWIAALLAEELLRQRDMIAALAELAAPLIGALEATRGSLDLHGPASPSEIARAVQGAVLAGRGAENAAPFERLSAGQARIEAAVQSLLRQPPPAIEAPQAETATVTAGATARKARPQVRTRSAPPPAAPDSQPDLPMLAEPEPEERLDWADLMRAFDFPRDADDGEGFDALRRALRHRSLAQMLQAAEDVLTLLSQEGVYVDDVVPATADTDAWRRFVAGERGAAVAAMGGVADAATLDAARALMKADPIFRDTALFFQRRFDVVLGEIAATASDAELAQLADTRSGRAFQLMARASGAFD